MAGKSIRLGSTLTFDTEKEADIIKLLEYLNKCHKTGAFITNLIRLAVDCPDVLKKGSDGTLVMGASLKKIDIECLSEIRKDFMRDVTKQIAQMKDKVDAIYEQALKTYILAQMGKRIGLEGKSENILRADFVVEKQLATLQNSLGVYLNDNVYASNKLANIEKIAEDAIELIIETYDGMIAEIKKEVDIANPQIANQQIANQMFTEQALQPMQTVQSVQQQVQSVQSTSTQEIQSAVAVGAQNTVQQQVQTATTMVQSDKTSDMNDEIIDFGSDPDDLDILANFFGE